MTAVEIVGTDGRTPDPVRVGSISAYCHARGVVTLTAGTFGNVLRFLPPLVMPDHLLEEAFDVTIPPEDALHLTTVGAVVRYVSRHAR